jgi:hypothetical protein
MYNNYTKRVSSDYQHHGKRRLTDIMTDIVEEPCNKHIHDVSGGGI